MTETAQKACGLDLARKLEAVFGRIERERMEGVPILNPALKVAAIGMQPVGEAWICALVTPWCINLMLLPRTPDDAQAWMRESIGAKVKHVFPAGTFEFICGAEDELGPYRMCSLFSPVLQFDSQEAARATAEAALAALFNEGFDAPEPSAAAPKKAGLSRRNLIFGARARP